MKISINFRNFAKKLSVIFYRNNFKIQKFLIDYEPQNCLSQTDFHPEVIVEHQVSNRKNSQKVPTTFKITFTTRKIYFLYC